MSDFDADYLREIEREEASANRQVPQDRLTQVRKACEQAANLQLEIADHESALSEAKEKLRRLTSERIPALMEQAEIRDLTINGKGNLPDKYISLKTFCHANIAASWPADRRSLAFDALRAHDAADLIKYTVEFKFPRGHELYMKRLLDVASSLRLEANIKESVHSQTLSKWLREQRKAGKPHPPLDVIGASVGQEAVIVDVD